MLFAIAAVLFAVWVAGVVTSNFLGGFIHFFLISAITVVIARLTETETQ